MREPEAVRGFRVTPKKPDPAELKRRRKRMWDNRSYHKRRGELIEYLRSKAGTVVPVCACCGNAEDLQLDHINQADKEFDGPALRKKHRGTQVAYYWRKAKEGKIQILCMMCNRSKNRPGADCGCGGNGWNKNESR